MTKGKRNRHKRYKFIGVDGEGVTDPNTNVHEYVMLCASTGEHVENSEGLSTAECFEFLLMLKRKYPDHTLVGFAFTYDVNMMLRDVPRVQLKPFWQDRSATLIFDDEMYDVTWIPTKFISIKTDVTTQVSDVFGFFQTSFVTALTKWEVPDIDGALERIKAGKEVRHDFNVSDMPEMLRYCHAECEMLVELVDRLQDSLVDAGLYIKNWIGAGSVGQALIDQNGVLTHHVHDYTLEDSLQTAVMYAYFGGRFEMFRQGYFEDCYNYDIVSAYPYQCLDLPSLKGTWLATDTYDPKAEYSLWLVKWKVDSSRVVMPFPYRWKGAIYYPSEGKGWYWGREVAAAIRMFPEGIKVLQGYTYTPDSDVKPFAFVADVFLKRKAAKAAGQASEKAYKLGLNSLYGKLAQGKGYKGSVPRQRSFIWAGMICSNTRALLLDTMLGREDSIIAVATDGLFFSEDPELPTGTELGDLEVTYVPEFFQLLNGIYYSPNAKIRTRGHSPKELDWDSIVEEWKTEKVGGVYRYTTTRFIGLGQALMRKDFSIWRRWVSTDRQLNLHQFIRKWLDDEAFNSEFIDLDHNRDSIVTWYAGTVNGQALGEAYKPKTDVVVTPRHKADAEALLQYLEMMEQPQLFIEN